MRGRTRKKKMKMGRGREVALWMMKKMMRRRSEIYGRN